MFDAELAARNVLSVIGFRAAPMLLWAAVSRGSTGRVRLLAVPSVAVLAASIAAWSALPVAWIAAAYGYFALLACGFHAICPFVRRDRVTPGAVFALSATLFVLFPGLAIPVAAKPFAVVLGWEMMLSSYSYCMEASKVKHRPTLFDCLFFLLVNPVVVYPERGQRVERQHLDWTGVRRTALGVCVMALVVALGGPVREAERTMSLGSFANALSAIGMDRPVAFLVRYMEQSGVASFQIGLMLVLGFALPERYDAPLAATGPLDFWRRWNTYVGHWMQRYLFWPMSLGLARDGRTTGQGARAIGVLATFACVGALHDGSAYLTNVEYVGRGFAMFLGCGVLVLVWAGAERLPRSGRFRWVLERPRLVATASCVLFWWTALALFSVGTP